MLKASSYAFFNNSRQKLNNYRNKKKKSNESARHRTGPNFQQDILVYQAIGVKDDLKQKKKKRRRPYIGVDSRTYDLEKVTWMTNKMSHDFKTDKAYITSNVAEFIMFLIFMIFPIVVALNQVPTLKFHQEKGLKRQLVYKPFKADHNSDKMYLFEDIRSRNFLFKYLNATMIQGEWLMQFYGQYSPQNQRQLTPIWYIVGHPQLRQIRVRKDSCNVHPVFRLFIKDCYDYFAPENEQREQIYPLKQVFMYDVYITRLYRDIHWKYREGRFSDSVTFDTNLGSYTGGGYVAELEAGPRGPNSNALLFTYLSDFVWLDRATRICLLEILVYNPHTNLMSAVKVFFEFPPTGGVFPRIDIKTAQVFHLLTAYDYFILGMLALLVAYSLYFIVEEARNIAYFRERFLFVFWSYIDIAIICVILTVLIFFIKINSRLQYSLERYQRNAQGYTNMDDVFEVEVSYNNCLALLIFLCFLRLVRYLRYFGVIQVFFETYELCKADLVSFAFCYFLVLFAFTQMAYFLFSRANPEFQDLSSSLYTLLHMNFGYINYERLTQGFPIISKMFFIFYSFVMNYMMLYMFLLIIYHNYRNAENETCIQRGQSAAQIMCGLTRKMYHRCFRPVIPPLPSDYITVEEIKEALELLKFTRPEIDLFLKKYDIIEENTVEPEIVPSILSELRKKGGLDRAFLEKLKADRKPIVLPPIKPPKYKPLTREDFLIICTRIDQIELHVETMSERLVGILAAIDMMVEVQQAARRRGLRMQEF